MPDREKVIKGIQECDLNGGLIGNCPYKEVVELLKEQEVVEPIIMDQIVFGTSRKCSKCNQYLFPAGRYCPNCGGLVTWDD